MAADCASGPHIAVFLHGGLRPDLGQDQQARELLVERFWRHHEVAMDVKIQIK
jgi:hypothetical protein